MLKAAGKEGKTTKFLLTDTQIKEEAFLEDVDGLLNAGEVAILFALNKNSRGRKAGRRRRDVATPLLLFLLPSFSSYLPVSFLSIRQCSHWL